MEKWFPQGIEGLLDDAVKAVVRPIEDSLEFVDFLVFVMSMGTRRLKFLFCAEEMAEEEKTVPELKPENLSSMVDDEITAAFFPLSPMDKVKFIMAVRKADGPVAVRFDALLHQMKSGERATREQNTIAIARRAQEEACKAREAAFETERTRVRTDPEALKFIAQAPEGRFQTVSDLDAAVEDEVVFDWVNRKEIPAGDAMVVGKCLITDKRTAERLAEKIRRPQDKNRPLAFTIATTREWLAQCEKERESARKRQAEEARAEQSEREAFTAEVRGAFARTITIPDKELARNQLKAQAGDVSWKRDIIRREAESKEYGIFETFRNELRERFPHSCTFQALDVFITETEAHYNSRANAEGWSENVVKGAERQVNMIRRHRQWLTDNPRGVVQPAPQAEIISIGRWESSSDRSVRPKFGPGSGIGGVKREKTPEERLIHRGRQIANGDYRYWAEKFKKPVEKFTDEDFKKVVELFGDVKGDRKAAKKQGGGKRK